MEEEIDHEIIFRMVADCTKRPCITAGCISRQSIFDLLHNDILYPPMLVKCALGICREMSYLHQNNIIYRDLRTANLLVGEDRIVRIADFSVARCRDQGDAMTAETGTYRWMAPELLLCVYSTICGVSSPTEIINHKPYDHKSDLFSFDIVLWEIATSKVPYETLSPTTAALRSPHNVRFLLDSGASIHVVGDARLLRGIRRLPGAAARYATLPDGTRLPIAGVGAIQTRGFRIPDVYLVEGVTVNLISVGRLATNHDICCCFYRNRCQLMALAGGARVGEAVLDEDGVYRLAFLRVPGAAA
ncbi:hypothetical protein ACP4OV_002340 [Aristida adscensionis]